MTQELVHVDILNEVYRERDQLVAALSKHYPSHFAIDETEKPEWRHVICVHLPTGQATWHIHESELELFEHLAERDRPQHWDGHDTDEKYRRVGALHPYIQITMRCGDNDRHVMGVYRDEIGEKYPLWCEQCEETVGSSYPFSIATEIGSE